MYMWVPGKRPAPAPPRPSKDKAQLQHTPPTLHTYIRQSQNPKPTTPKTHRVRVKNSTFSALGVVVSIVLRRTCRVEGSCFSPKDVNK